MAHVLRSPKSNDSGGGGAGVDCEGPSSFNLSRIFSMGQTSVRKFRKDWRCTYEAFFAAVLSPRVRVSQPSSRSSGQAKRTGSSSEQQIARSS